MRKLLFVVALVAVTVAGCGGDDDGGGDAAGTTEFSGSGSGDFCDLARRYEQDFDDTGTSTESADVEKEYKELAAAIDQLVAEAPSEIEPDAQTVNDAFKELNRLLEKYDYDFSKIPQDEADAMDLDDAEVQAASNRVESYFETVCGIDADDDGDTDGTIDDGATSGEEQAPVDTEPPTGGAAEPGDTTATTEG